MHERRTPYLLVACLFFNTGCASGQVDGKPEIAPLQNVEHTTTHAAEAGEKQGGPGGVDREGREARGGGGGGVFSTSDEEEEGPWRRSTLE